MRLEKKKIEQFQKQILDWYKLHKRDLPWRHPSLRLQDGSRDPYKILVSEIMLQQTQVTRVIPKYNEWLRVFPDLQTLSQAPSREVLLHWSGLGYNRRALYLQKFAKEVVDRFEGEIPQDEQQLMHLPGIGKYTANALLCFAFDRQVAVVDTNIRKVIAVHFFRGVLPEEKIIESVALQLLPPGKAYEWNQALMDYAGSELKKEKIPIPRQAQFFGSNRYFRGLTMRILLEEKQVTFENLFRKVTQARVVGQENYQKILKGLEKDGMVEKVGNIFRITE